MHMAGCLQMALWEKNISNMRDIHTERSDNFCCLHFLYSKYLQNWRCLPRFTMIGR
jgi:hypothetical protein